uniref:Protein MMS22-like N-terminal domain-containing protein n=1 Tax=Amphimedon queenslandica TaxID=400682 RepID=A0A1X7TAN7_AMPQE
MFTANSAKVFLIALIVFPIASLVDPFLCLASLYNIISSTGNSILLEYCCEFLHFIVTYISRLSLMTHTATLDGIITNLTNTIQSLESCDQLNEDGIHSFLELLYQCISGTGSMGFNWWVLVQCSALYGYSNDGVWNDDFKINAQWTIIKDIINKTLNSDEGELAHRWSINCCNYIYNNWSPFNAYPIIIAWEYYLKNV